MSNCRSPSLPRTVSPSLPFPDHGARPGPARLGALPCGAASPPRPRSARPPWHRSGCLPCTRPRRDPPAWCGGAPARPRARRDSPAPAPPPSRPVLARPAMARPRHGRGASARPGPSLRAVAPAWRGAAAPAQCGHGARRPWHTRPLSRRGSPAPTRSAAVLPRVPAVPQPRPWRSPGPGALGPAPAFLGVPALTAPARPRRDSLARSASVPAPPSPARSARSPVPARPATAWPSPGAPQRARLPRRARPSTTRLGTRPGARAVPRPSVRPRCLLAARSAACAQLGPGVRAARSRRISAALHARVLAWCMRCFGTTHRALGALVYP
eukprot:XP_020395478.1 vegetative cell wall protein gp1-like [Zea mays]